MSFTWYSEVLRFYFVSDVVLSASNNVHILFSLYISSVDIIIPVLQKGQERSKEILSHNHRISSCQRSVSVLL